MQNISEDIERKASERADYINRYISLSDALQKGIVQMGNSFSAKQNQEIIVSISGLMSQMGELSDVQKKNVMKWWVFLGNKKILYCID